MKHRFRQMAKTVKDPILVKIEHSVPGPCERLALIQTKSVEVYGTCLLEPPGRK